MKFTAPTNKVVRVAKGKLVSFSKGVYETTDKDEIARLKKAKNVTEVKATK